MRSVIPIFTGILKVNVLLRLVFGPVIFLSPVFATVVNLFLDGFDGEIFKRAGYARPKYGAYDKILDYWWYVWIIIFLVYNNVPALWVFVALFAFRSVGQALYLAFHTGYLLFLFPNIFELMFYYYLAARHFGQEAVWLTGTNVVWAIAVLGVLGYAREIIIHIKELNFSGVYLGKTSYWPTRTVNSYKVFIFMSLALGFMFGVNRILDSQSTQRIVSYAAKADRDGSIISYSREGKLVGTSSTATAANDILLIRTSEARRPVVCKSQGRAALRFLGNNGVFMYDDRCIRDLPDGSYELIFYSPAARLPVSVIGFGIRDAGLVKR